MTLSLRSHIEPSIICKDRLLLYKSEHIYRSLTSNTTWHSDAPTQKSPFIWSKGTTTELKTC